MSTIEFLEAMEEANREADARMRMVAFVAVYVVLVAVFTLWWVL